MAAAVRPVAAATSAHAVGGAGLEVGGAKHSTRLTTEALADEPAALSDVPEDVRHAGRGGARRRRPGGRAGLRDRGAHRCRGVSSSMVLPPIPRSTVGRDAPTRSRWRACLAVAQANHLVRPRGPMPVKAVTEHFGLASAPSTRVLALRHAVTGIRSWSGETSLRSPRYLTSQRRGRPGGVPRPAAGGGGRRPGELTTESCAAQPQIFSRLSTARSTLPWVLPSDRSSSSEASRGEMVTPSANRSITRGST